MYFFHALIITNKKELLKSFVMVLIVGKIEYMRIASYNIMSGGFDSYTCAAAMPQRLPVLKAAIRALEADIVGLVDTFRWDEVFSTNELRKLFDYNYAFCINLNDDRLRKKGHNNGLTLLSNVPLTDAHALRIATRDAIVARLPGNITLVLAYLDDLSEDTRLGQVKALSSKLSAKEPTIVIGDLNAVKKNEVAALKEWLAVFYKDNPDLEDKQGPIITDMQRGEVITLLESLGLQDADTTSSPTFPTRLFPAKSDRPFVRLAYCFHSSSVKITNFTVRTQNIFQKASDHFPIVFDAEIR
jgi:endonuclease/exonuclease/phosphatase family metal-dependent hydrolase